jgi:hypothetical protein
LIQFGATARAISNSEDWNHDDDDSGWNLDENGAEAALHAPPTQPAPSRVALQVEATPAEVVEPVVWSDQESCNRDCLQAVREGTLDLHNRQINSADARFLSVALSNPEVCLFK